MAYRLIYTEFWDDPKITEEMTPEDRYFYLFLLTNQWTTNCGIYMITKKKMAFVLGYSTEAVNSLMDRFENQYKLIVYNSETRELAIKNWGKYNLARGGKPVIDCLTSELKKVKDKNLIKYITENISNQCIRKLYEAFYDTSAIGELEVALEVDNTNTDTDTISNTNTSTITSTDTDTNTKEDTFSTESSLQDITEDEEDRGVHSLSISLIKEYEKITGKVGIFNLPSIKIAVSRYGYSNVKKAIDASLEKDKLSMAYVNGILRTWEKEGYPKDNDVGGAGAISNSKFAGFKPQEPETISEEELRRIKDELI